MAVEQLSRRHRARSAADLLDVEGALRAFDGTGKPASVSYATTIAAETSPLDDLTHDLAKTAGV